MSGTPIDETLNALQTARLGSTKFKAASQEIIRLAQLADAKNQPARDKKRSESKAAGSVDLTPTWQSVLNHFVCGIRNKRNDKTVIEQMVADLREMAVYATADAIDACP